MRRRRRSSSAPEVAGRWMSRSGSGMRFCCCSRAQGEKGSERGERRGGDSGSFLWRRRRTTKRKKRRDSRRTLWAELPVHRSRSPCCSDLKRGKRRAVGVRCYNASWVDYVRHKRGLHKEGADPGVLTLLSPKPERLDSFFVSSSLLAKSGFEDDADGRESKRQEQASLCFPPVSVKKKGRPAVKRFACNHQLFYLQSN